MMDLLSIDVVRSNAATTVVLAGEIDFASESSLTDALVDAVESSREVFVDLGLVTYLDSTGIRALVVAYEEAGARDGAVTIRRASAQVRRVLDASGVLALLTGAREAHG